MGWLFGTRNKEAEESKILSMMQREDVSMQLILKKLIDRDEHKTNPHNQVPLALGKRTDEIIQKLKKEKVKKFPVAMFFLQHKIFIHGIESYARLRALRSTGKKKIRLVQTKKL